MDPTESLPEDALASILGRLPACELAASRCVRKAWRAVIDARRLLLPHLLPHSLQGIFINYIDYERPHCLSRPSAQKPLIDGNLDYLPWYTGYFSEIIDHCNGLLLYEAGALYVVNPATRRWDYLPCKDRNQAYLAFDPAISPHYELFFIPDVPGKAEQEGRHGFMEWPPSLWTMNVFSSSSRQWQKRSFLRQGDAVGTVASVREDPWKPASMYHGGPLRRFAVYRDGSLYVHCRGAFVTRYYNSCMASFSFV
jgi:hypothetical protein